MRHGGTGRKWRQSEKVERGAKKCRKPNGETAEQWDEETHECIQVCVNIRQWQSIFGQLFLVLELSLG